MKIVTTLVCLALSSLFVHAQGEVAFATGEWAPYTGDKLPDYGAACEIVTAACKAGGISQKYQFFPWKRAEASVANGDAFATFPYLKTPERAETFDFSDPIFSSSIGVMRNVGNDKTKDFKFQKIEDLKGFRVGTTSGTMAVTDPCIKAGVACEDTVTLEQTISKLQMGRIDFVIEERAAVMDAVKKTFPEKVGDFKFVEGDFKEKSQYLLLVSKKYPNSKEILSKFNEGLKKIKADGTAAKIYAKYGMIL